MKRRLIKAVFVTCLLAAAGCDSQKTITPPVTSEAPKAEVKGFSGGEKLTLPPPGTK